MNCNMPSYEKINYLLRPNKSVERKMVCEMLSRISAIRDITGYQYIGLGSTYFADFSLFHRHLGILKMISIENEERAQNRCEFNKPFGCIELKIGDSVNVLPNLEIDKRDSIIWLDYDGVLSNSVFSDINTAFGMMKPDSFFMMSINTELKNCNDDQKKLQTVIDMVGEERFPKRFSKEKINSRIFEQILYECIIQEISSVLQKRNSMEKSKIRFHQTILFKYSDGARMITLGGFLFSENEEDEHLQKMGIRNMFFYKHDNTFFHIQCPVLSLKEIQVLNSHLPCKEMGKHGTFEDEELNNFPIDNSDIGKYATLYRYYPSYTESLL